ncbi:MAG TPA: hypothetical protein VK067_07485 [Pseudogracilibacillus sp.]|nr:hypothetical protein [Pseudogracilibacillus sp.]
MDHPVIREIEATGYPMGYKEQEHLGIDALGTEIIEGDVLFRLYDEVFVESEISYDAVDVLKTLGATREIAK